MASPVKTITYGRIKINVWERQSEKFGTITSYSLSASYKDKDEKWVNQSVSLNNLSDLICVIQCIQAVFEYKYRKDEAQPEP